MISRFFSFVSLLIYIRKSDNQKREFGPLYRMVSDIQMARKQPLETLTALPLDGLRGSLIVLATVLLLELSRQLGHSAPNPQLFTAVAVTYAAFSGGYAGGLAGAFIGVGYALYFFSSPDGHFHFHFTEINSAKVVVNAITLPAIALLVSRLKHGLAASLQNQTQRFIASANAFILGVDRDGRITVWNDKVERLTGYSLDELNGQRLDELLSDDAHKTAIKSALDAALAGRETSNLDLSVSGKTGNQIELLISFAPERDIRARIAGMTGVGQDVTEHMRAERALRASEGRVAGLMQNAADGIVTIDTKGIIESFNAAAEKIFGYTRDEVSGRNVRLLMPADEGMRHDGYLLAYLQTGQGKIVGVGSREVVGQRKDGSTFPMDLAIGEQGAGENRTFIGIICDITERKRAEVVVLAARDAAEFANRAKNPNFSPA